MVCVLRIKSITGIHFEISSLFKFVSSAFAPKAKCRKVTEETLKQQQQQQPPPTTTKEILPKRHKNSELGKPQPSLFVNSDISKKE